VQHSQYPKHTKKNKQRKDKVLSAVFAEQKVK
jgi:hypothetical protein